MSTDLLGGSQVFSTSLTMALIGVALVYLWGWRQLHIVFPHVLSTWRLAAFLCGLFVMWVAAGSPLAALDHVLLTVHMAQHLLLMTVAAPMILLGAPVITLLFGLPEGFVGLVLMPLARCQLLRQLGRSLTHPVLCWLASTFVVIGWHIPVVFEVGLRSQWWHEIQQASFFAAGILFWWPVVQPWPSVARWPRWSVPLYLFLATLPCDALSAFLTFCDRVVYPHYFSARRLFNVSPIGDQELAGALMWVCVTFAYLIPAAVVIVQMLSPRRRVSKVQVV